MLCKDYQILDVYYPVTPGHRADIARWLVRAPVVYYNAHVRGVNNFITVEVNDWID